MIIHKLTLLSQGLIHFMRAMTLVTTADQQKRLVKVNLPHPKINAEQVLIKVMAAGINRPDLLQKQGLYPAPAGASPILGLEVSGYVIELGAKVNTLAINQAVCALVSGGAYAEYCVAEASSCLVIPDSLSFIEAAAIPETFFTVWYNVYMRGQLQAHESLLVHGGGSGIGTTAILLAKAMGNPIFVTASSLDKCQKCLALGATSAINYQAEDFVAKIKKLTNNIGVNAILDMIGGDYLPRNLLCLAPEGRLLQIAIQRGAKAEINLWQVMAKQLVITGSTLRIREQSVKAQIAEQLKNQVWPLFANGQLKPVIDSIYPLAEVEQAQQRMTNNQHFGKIILEV